MFENRDEPVVPIQTFLLRLFYGIVISLLIILIALAIGMIGYHLAEPSMTWMEAFMNAALVLSDMGPVTPAKTHAGMLFISLYALFSGLAFVTIIGIILAPIIHRFLHQFHAKKKN